jgi:hypothetical protein
VKTWHWVVLGIVLFTIVVVGVWVSLGKKKPDEAQIVPPPPPPGAASRDELTTSLGQARGLDEGVAPTSVKWTRVFVIDDRRVLLTGEAVTEAIGMLTEDAGKTWKSLRADRGGSWTSWAVSLDGSIVLGTGSRDGAPTPQSAQAEGARLLFGTFDGDGLTVATPLFPTLKGPVKGLLQTVSAMPALTGPASAVMVVDEGPRKASLVYGGKPGAEAAPPLKLPAGEKIVPVPYGRPPQMLSIKGRDVMHRPFPVAGAPLDKPEKIPGLTAAPALFAELAAAPRCEMAGWSFQRVLNGTKKPMVFGVSPSRIIQMNLPEAAVPGTGIGCGANHVTVEAVMPKTGAPALWAEQPDVPTILTCDLKGKCPATKNAPFRMWPGAHKREIATAPTSQGTLAVMYAYTGDRWGLYLAQAQDGITWERQRPIGEGTGDRGRIELGALVSLGKRVLLLITADVTGTSRRGWFVMASDDGGTSWELP